MTMAEINQKIKEAHLSPLMADGTAKTWDLLPRVPYSELPPKLKKEADKITVSMAKKYLIEIFPVGSLDDFLSDEEVFNAKILEALHSAKYLVESTDLTPPPKTGNVAVDTANAESWKPVSLIASDLAEAWENVTQIGINPLFFKCKPFSIIRQGTVTNAFSKLNTTKGKTKTDLMGSATITSKEKSGDLTVKFPDFSKITGLRTSTHKLLAALTIVLTESGANSPCVRIALSDYMDKCGLKARQIARNQVAADLETLFNARITYQEKPGKSGKSGSFMDMRIIEAKGIDKKGSIAVKFSDSYFQMLKKCCIMPLPEQYFRINPHNNPHSCYFLQKIAEHKNMNVGKAGEDIISVKILLSSSPVMPSEKEVKASRNYDVRIVKPFERDMDALEETLSWEYCHNKGLPLSADEKESFDYSTFKKLYVKITWKNYPDQTARLEKKELKKAAAKSKIEPKKAAKKA